MKLLSRLLRFFSRPFRRAPALDAASTLELSRSDIEILDVVWERY